MWCTLCSNYEFLLVLILFSDPLPLLCSNLNTMLMVSRYFRRTLFSAAKSETSAAAASARTTGHNPLEEFFEADRSQDEEKPVVYGTYRSFPLFLAVHYPYEFVYLITLSTIIFMLKEADFNMILELQIRQFGYGIPVTCWLQCAKIFLFITGESLERFELRENVVLLLWF